MHLLLQLLQVALGTRESLSRVPSVKEWVDIFEMAQIQTVAGLAVDGLARLPLAQRPPQTVLYEWLGLVQIIEQQNRLHRKVIKKIHKCLKHGQVNVVFMKGLVCGSRYERPEHRQCGDIDFVIAEKDYKKTLDLLETIGNVDRELIHEHHGMAYVDGVQLEPHYKVHNFQNPRVDEAMKKLFAEIFPSKLVLEKIGEENYPIFPSAFECVILVGHMVNHVYAEGLGLRQVVDFMMFIEKKYKYIEWDACRRNLQMMRMSRAFRIFARICEDNFSMSPSLLNLSYSKKEISFAENLMKDIMQVGNFGRGKRNLGNFSWLVPIRSYLWVLKRCWKLYYLCPAEAAWWPLSKLRRYLFKKMHCKYFNNNLIV